VDTRYRDLPFLTGLARRISPAGAALVQAHPASATGAGASVNSEDDERRLAAILSADLVGHSQLMAQDEVATLKTLNAHRDAIGGPIRQHGEWVWISSSNGLA
jgi:class 3 adenylate cyclase